MRHQLIVGTWPGRLAIIAVALLTLAIGFCFFDGSEHGLLRHAHSPDPCTSLALVSAAIALLGLTAKWEMSMSPARPVYATSPRRLTPPPRPRPFL